jgi:S-DNA-T family DNA segregation ATPase FtsK/SpoIIIE
LRVPKDSEVILNQTSKKSIDIAISDIPQYLELDTDKILEDKIYIGESFNNQDLYIEFENLTHILTVGESGSGKSTLINLMLLSILKNIEKCQKLFLVDFKGVELYRYSKLPKVEFIDKVEQLINTLENITDIMNERYENLKQSGELKHKGDYIFVVLEEVGSISTFQDKKIKDKIFSLLTNLLQKARAANIYFLIFAQKIEVSVLPSAITTNIQGKILLKTDNDYNQNQTIGTKEIISKITNMEPGDFNRGRGIYKCGISSNTTVFQSPYFHKDIYKEFV